MRIPFQLEIGGRDFSEEEIRGVQERNLRGESTDDDRKTIDSWLSFICLNVIPK